MREIPYPAVFRDWRNLERRIAAGCGVAGVTVEILTEPTVDGIWRRVELTEEDACLLAATLLRAAGKKKLMRRVLRKLDPEPQEGEDDGDC